MNLHIKVSKVVFVRNSTDARDTEGWNCQRMIWPGAAEQGAYGSAMSRSVSLMIRFGSAIAGSTSRSKTREESLVVGRLGFVRRRVPPLVWAVRGKTLGRDQREGWLARSVSRRTRVMRRKSVKYKNGASSWQGCWRSEVAWQIDVNAGCFVARKASIRFGRFRGAPRVTRALHRARPHEALPHFSECISAANLCPRILIQTALGRAADPRESLSTSFSPQLPEPTRINYIGPYRAGF